jgi:hypothetical protein
MAKHSSEEDASNERKKTNKRVLNKLKGSVTLKKKKIGDELRLQLHCGKILREKGILFCSTPVGGPYRCAFQLVKNPYFYTKGWPDMIVLFKELTWVIEFKGPKGSLTPEQKIILSRFKKLKHLASVVTTVKQFRDYLKIIENNLKVNKKKQCE